MKELKIQNTVVLSGLLLKDANLSTFGEFDFIIISLPSKSIIQIEAKRGNNEKNREHAEKQLNQGQTFFEENFPFPSSKNWKYIKMMCIGESVTADICQNCKKFVFGTNLFSLDNNIKTISEEIAKQFTSYLKTVSYEKGK
jgi:hypothetical protein